LSELEDREVYEAVENLYMLDERQRRLFTVANLLPRALAARLHKWIEGGAARSSIVRPTSRRGFWDRPDDEPGILEQ
jgi:hypothetical protein